MNASRTLSCARAVLAITFTLLTNQCATKGVDGSTHFVRCTSDLGCRSEQMCNPEHQCVPRTPAPDASVPRTSAPDAAVTAPVGCASPPPADAALPPPDGRCGVTPRMLVSADTLPTPSDAGPVDVGFGWLFASPSALYYSSAAVQRTRAGVFVAGSAMRVPLEGGSSSVLASGYLFSKPVLAGTNLILDGSPVPSGNGDVIFSAPLSGGPPRKIASLDDEIVNGFATDGTYVYFSETSALKAMPLLPDAGSAEIITLVPGMSANIIGAFGNELLFGYPQGAVESLPLPPRANSPVTVLGTSLAGPLDLMPCGTNACWLAGANDTIEQLKLPDGAPMPVVTLTDGVSTAFDATYDGKYAYVIGTDYRRTRNTLARVPLDGSCPVVLIRMPSSDGASVAMDDECVYWSSSQGIFSLAKSSSGVFDQ